MLVSYNTTRSVVRFNLFASQQLSDISLLSCPYLKR